MIGRETVKALSQDYLAVRSNQLRPGGFKSVRFSIGLLVSLFGSRPISSLTREDGRRFVSLVAQLSPHVGKSCHAIRLNSNIPGPRVATNRTIVGWKRFCGKSEWDVVHKSGAGSACLV